MEEKSVDVEANRRMCFKKEEVVNYFQYFWQIKLNEYRKVTTVSNNASVVTWLGKNLTGVCSRERVKRKIGTMGVDPFKRVQKEEK